MKNTSLNRIINFVKNIDTPVWIAILTGIVLALGIWVVVNTVTGISNYFEDLETERSTRNDARQQIIDTIKRDCKIIHKNIGSVSTEVTYRCDDDIEYEFTEWL